MADWAKIGYRGNVEDRRGVIPTLGGISVTGLALMLLFNYLTGGNPMDVLEELPINLPNNNQIISTEEFEGEDKYEVFASTVLGSNNAMWEEEFRKIGKDYTAPKLVLFRTATQSLCGSATSQVGPHYCPLDETIYLDETFFEELETRFGARGGDVAEAYVISHEVAHHAQNQLGTMTDVQRQQNSQDANNLSTKLELQADCYAGMWAFSIKDQGVFTQGEIEEAIDAAAAVGDDRIQQKVTGYVNPESWTHGSSEQRTSWLLRGYETGNLESCNTFE